MLNVPVVGAATTAKHVYVAVAVADGPVLLSEFHWVSSIKFSCLVKFCMAAPGGIGAKAANAFGPVRLDQRSCRNGLGERS